MFLLSSHDYNQESLILDWILISFRGAVVGRRWHEMTKNMLRLSPKAGLSMGNSALVTVLSFLSSTSVLSAREALAAIAVSCVQFFSYVASYHCHSNNVQLSPEINCAFKYGYTFFYWADNKRSYSDLRCRRCSCYCPRPYVTSPVCTFRMQRKNIPRVTWGTFSMRLVNPWVNSFSRCPTV